MKKWMKIVLGIISGITILFAVDLICIFTFNRPLLAIKQDNSDPTNSVYRGLFYDTYKCHDYKKARIYHKGVKLACSISEDISLENISEYITQYFDENKDDSKNLSFYHIDLDKKKVVVGLVYNSKEEQSKFISKVFGSCCGSIYVKYIKDNSMIEFVESKYVFEASIIEVKDDEIIVKVLKDSEKFKKNVKVKIKVRDTDHYAKKNEIKITFNGNVLLSDPPRIEASKIEIIN